MENNVKKPISQVVLERITGLIVFLIFVIIVNLLADSTANQTIVLTANFVNENFWLILLFSILFFLGEFFGVMAFPLNIPAPVFNATAGVLLVAFLFRIFLLVDEITGITIFGHFSSLVVLLYVFVFCVILGAGYIIIFREI